MVLFQSAHSPTLELKRARVLKHSSCTTLCWLQIKNIDKLKRSMFISNLAKTVLGAPKPQKMTRGAVVSVSHGGGQLHSHTNTHKEED